MQMNKEKIKEFLNNNRKIIVIGAIGLVMLYLAFSTGGAKKSDQTQPSGVQPQSQITIDEKIKAEIESLRQQNLELQKQIKQLMETKEQKREAKEKELTSLKELEATLGRNKEKSTKKQLTKENQIETNIPMQPVQQIAPPPPPRIIKIDIPKDNSQNAKPEESKKSSSQNDIYLPAGSFAQFVLTSGAYAPAGGEQMPVSGAIKKAFVGPNKSVVPLRGCFFVGKARGIIGEGIADIKPITISCVFEDGTTFEEEIAGYVTDKNGKFGLPGKVQRHTGSFLATTGISSFLSGLASGWSRAYEQETAVAAGEAVEKTVNILGNAFRYGALKGLVGIADAAKAFYEAQLKELIPSVDVSAGSEGYIYITKGITIKGGKKKNESTYPYQYNTVKY